MANKHSLVSMRQRQCSSVTLTKFVIFIMIIIRDNLINAQTDPSCSIEGDVCCCNCGTLWTCKPICGCDEPITTTPSLPETRTHLPFYFLWFSVGCVISVLVWCLVPLLCNLMGMKLIRVRDWIYLRLCSRSLLLEREEQAPLAFESILQL